jgi:hypothetical protein
LGRPKGQPDGRTKHLLAGFIVCACGARFENVRGHYVCSARRRKGDVVCPSDLVFPAASIEDSFLTTIEHEVLAEPFIDHLVKLAFATSPDEERERWLADRARLASEVTNLTAAIAAGGNIPALVKLLTAKDKELKAVEAKLARPVLIPDRDALRDALERRAGQWRDILRSKHVEQGRMVLQHLIDLPIQVHNEPMPKWLAAARPEGLGPDPIPWTG